MRKLPLVLTLMLASTPLAAAEVKCPKESVIHGGIDRSLPCSFQSPLPWQDHRVMFARGSSTLDAEAKAILDRQADCGALPP